jgi:hypothetical protein
LGGRLCSRCAAGDDASDLDEGIREYGKRIVRRRKTQATR